MKFGPLQLDGPLVAAPMAYNTKRPYRILARRHGAALAYAEMAHADALLRRSQQVERNLRTEHEPRPWAAQLSGADPASMAEATRVLADRGFEVIDVNMGCPEDKYTGCGAGAALLRDPPLAGRIVEAMVRAAPWAAITVKLRAGWDLGETCAPEIARVCEAAGAAAVTVHGRSREQYFRGTVDLAPIAQTKAALSIPVLGNGDIKDGPSAARMLRETGCDGLMIGRAALGRPWLFEEIAAYLRGDPPPAPPTPAESAQAFEEHFAMNVQDCGLPPALIQLRRYACWYLRGIPYAAKLRDQAQNAADAADVQRIAEAIREAGCAEAIK